MNLNFKNGFFILILSGFVLFNGGVFDSAMGQDKIPEKQTEQNIKSDQANNKLNDTDNVKKAREKSSGNTDLKNQEGESLFSTVKQGGPLMIFLVFLGLGAMTIIIERGIFYTKNSIWKGQLIEDLIKKRAETTSTQFREDMEDDLRNFFSIYVARLEKGLALLYGIGNLAPIAGFLGTVIGMISAFASIAAATTVNAKVVAVGIQVALVTTAGGLIVAAPTLAFFYFYTHVIQSRISQAETVICSLSDTMPRISSRMNDTIPGE